jgi:hypothetical protein
LAQASARASSRKDTWLDRALVNDQPLALFAATMEEITLPAFMKDYKDVFSETGVGELAPNAEHDHAIDIEPNKRPPYKPIYNLRKNSKS